MGEAVALVPATWASLPAVARTAAPAWACEREQCLVAAEEARESSQEFLRQRPLAWRSRATLEFDRQRAAPRFVAAWRDPTPSVVFSPGRRRERQARSARPQSAQRVPLAFRNRPVTSSSRAAGPSSRSSAWPPTTSQVLGRLA